MESVVRQRVTAQGFTLLELLVGIVVLSLGVLSVASLQITTTQGNFSASQRLEAVMLAESAANRLRGNSERLDNYASTALDGSSAPIGNPPTGCTAGMPEAACLTATATLDLWELSWELYRSKTLVDPQICISQNTDNPGEMTVVVAWAGMTDRAGGSVDNLDDCGQDADDPSSTDRLQQVVVSTYVTNRNPY